MKMKHMGSPRAARERKIEDRVARSVVREMGIGERYERNITPLRSDISRLSGGPGWVGAISDEMMQNVSTTWQQFAIAS